MAVPECSVVIRTFNEAKHLGSLFDAIERQTYDDHEVIVVDSGSYDGTVETALSRTDHVHQINSRDFTFGYSLNVGIRAARYLLRDDLDELHVMLGRDGPVWTEAELTAGRDEAVKNLGNSSW